MTALAVESVKCPCCDGEGRVGWNLSWNNDPQCAEDAECSLCKEEGSVTRTAALEWLERVDAA